MDRFVDDNECSCGAAIHARAEAERKVQRNARSNSRTGSIILDRQCEPAVQAYRPPPASAYLLRC
jgi:hypothetical protein